MYLLDYVFEVGDDSKIIDKILKSIPGIKNKFDYELRDDIMDHWNHKCHEKERDMLISKLFELNKKYRVTIMSGDVHLMSVGKLESNGDTIYNVISSAIGNEPPSNFVVSAYSIKVCE